MQIFDTNYVRHEVSFFVTNFLNIETAALARAYLGIGSGTGSVTNTGNLTLGQVVIGNGVNDIKVLNSPADATKFLNGASSPAFAAVKDSDLSTSNITTNNVTIAKHGFAPILPNDASKFLDGTGNYSTPAGGGSVTNTGALVNHAVVVGNGGVDVSTIAAGTTNTVLKGSTGNDPAFGAVIEADISLSVASVVNDVAVGTHGFAPAGNGNANQFLDGTGAYSTPPGGGTVSNTGTLTDHGVIVGNGAADVSALAVGTTNTLLHGVTGADPAFSAVVEADITLADNATNNVSTTKHGFAPKAPNDATKYLDGQGNYTVPAGSGGSDVWANFIEATLIAGGATTSVPTGCTRIEVGTASAQAADANQLASINLATTGTVNNDSYHASSSTTNGQWMYGRETQWVAWFRPIETTTTRYWCGITASAPATQAGSDTPAGNYAMFRYSTSAGDTNWQAVVGDNSTTEVIDTGVAVSVATMVKLEIRWDGTASNSFDFYINDSLVASGTLNPASTALFHFACQQRTLANAIKNMRVAAQKIRVYYP